VTNDSDFKRHESPTGIHIARYTPLLRMTPSAFRQAPSQRPLSIMLGMRIQVTIFSSCTSSMPKLRRVAARFNV
jgi:hypothetical protein